MLRTCLFLAWLCLMLVPARAGHSPPPILLRIYVQTNGEGLAATQAHEITIPPDNETIQIRALPEVTEGNLNAVETDAAGHVHFHFDHEGQVNLDAVTAQNQGRILVVFINGYIIYAPTIDEEISDGELVIPHPLPAEVVQILQDTAKRNVAKEKHA
jgi:preprotein translocase subunit SecD